MAYGPCEWGLPYEVKLAVQGSCFIVVIFLRFMLKALLDRRVSAIGVKMETERNREQQKKSQANQPHPTVVHYTDTGKLAKADVVICLVGTTGSGKSATANLISRSSGFREGDDPKSVTRISSYQDFNYKDKIWRIIDTPGLQDTELSAKEITRRIKKFANFAPQGVDAFFVVWRASGGRFSDTHQKSIDILKHACGNAVLHHAAIVYTDIASITSVKASPSHQTFAAWIKDKCLEVDKLKLVMQQLDWRFVGIDNQNGNRDEHRTNLLHMVEVMATNNPLRFQTADLRAAEKWQADLEKRIGSLSKPHAQQSMQEHLENMFKGEGGSNSDTVEAAMREFEKDEAETGGMLSVCNCSWKPARIAKHFSRSLALNPVVGQPALLCQWCALVVSA